MSFVLQWVTLCDWDIPTFYSTSYRQTDRQTVISEKTSPFYICVNVVSCHPILPILGRGIPKAIGNKYTYMIHTTQHTTSQFHVFVLYLVKTSNDFYSLRYSNKYTKHCISLPRAVGHRILPTWFQLTIKSGESYRSVSTAGPYTTLLIWSDVWLLHVLTAATCHDEAIDRRHGRMCVHLRENWCRQFENMFWCYEQSFYLLLLTLYLLVSDVTIGLLHVYGNFIFWRCTDNAVYRKNRCLFLQGTVGTWKRSAVGCVGYIC